MSNSLYERMKAKGIDMTWYEKNSGHHANSRAPTPLYDEACGRLSIYILEKGGKLYTTTSTGEKYMLARIVSTKPKSAVYLCAACGAQFKTFKEATDHYAKQ